jgi:uncharacterized protein
MKAIHNSVLDQMFSIPIDAERMIIYAPLKRIAFISNQAMVNAIFNRCEGNDGTHDDRNHLRFLEHLHFFETEAPPNDIISSDGSTAYVTMVFFRPNKGNLRCTEWYASSGDYEVRKMTWTEDGQTWC